MDTKCFLLLWSYFPTPVTSFIRIKIYETIENLFICQLKYPFPCWVFSLCLYFEFAFLQLLWPNLKKFSFHIKKKRKATTTKIIIIDLLLFLLIVVIIFIFILFLESTQKREREKKRGEKKTLFLSSVLRCPRILCALLHF